jgi:CRISPR-associated endonuclease Cas1
MAASHTVPELSVSHNSQRLTPRHGVLTLSGYGIMARIERGHLVLRDAIGREQREGRFSRVGHGLRRLVVIGNDGMISLAALRWLHDQKAAFVMLERSGRLLTAVGPIGPKDSRLRRAQAVAHETGEAIGIARLLLDKKLSAQEALARHTLRAEAVANAIQTERSALAVADSIDALRWAEARSALAYWSAWHAVPIEFPRAALRRVPEHWRTFGARRSPLTGSPRLAVNPPNAMLNYLYALLESEARIAAVTVGLDPNLGLLHADTEARASLACDLMEAIRPQVDAYVLDWITREPLRREWFFEHRDGNCRLMAHFASQLAETAPTWAQAIAPIAERVAAMLWETIPGARSRTGSSRTPLTQRHRREAKHATGLAILRLPAAPRVCRSCGAILRKGRRHCRKCANATLSNAFPRVMKQGRTVAQRPEATAKRSATQRRNAQALAAWRTTDLPAWLTPQAFAQRVQPRLSSVRTADVARTLKVSESYAARIRSGERAPHPRHWVSLAELSGVTPQPIPAPQPT